MQRQLVAAYERRGECRWCVRESEREQQRNDVARSIGSNGPIKQCAYGVSYSAGLVKSPQAPSALRTMRSRYPGHGIIKVALGGPQGRGKLVLLSFSLARFRSFVCLPRCCCRIYVVHATARSSAYPSAPPFSHSQVHRLPLKNELSTSGLIIYLSNLSISPSYHLPSFLPLSPATTTFRVSIALSIALLLPSISSIESSSSPPPLLVSIISRSIALNLSIYLSLRCCSSLYSVGISAIRH